jgi:hypothetical protein
MHFRAITEPEVESHQRTLRDAISDRRFSDRDVSDARQLSASLDSVFEVAHRGYRSGRARSAEIVVHRRAMSYAKYYDRKNSERESLTERVSTILSMSPALRPMKESA